jgi:hypothetical protein
MLHSFLIVNPKPQVPYKKSIECDKENKLKADIEPARRVDSIQRTRSVSRSPRTETSRAPRSTNQYADGESLRVRILEHLGGGKLIIDLRGQRAVASTDLMLEKGQEIDVIARNIGENRIILQIEPSIQQSIRSDPPAAVRLPLGDIMNQLVTSLSAATESAFPAMDETLKQLLLKVRKLVDRIPVSSAKGDLPQQIRNAINTLGYGYEGKKEDADLQLKAELMKLRALLNEKPLGSGWESRGLAQPKGDIRESGIQNKLLRSIDDMLQSIEFQQLKSVLNSEDLCFGFASQELSKYSYLQIPIIFQDNLTTVQMELFHAGTDNEENNDCLDVKLDFDLDRLGHIAFFIRLTSGHIHCQIMADQHETYNFIKNHSEDLRVRLTALGYSVDEIQCLRENPKAYAGVGSIVGTEDIDITV